MAQRGSTVQRRLVEALGGARAFGVGRAISAGMVERVRSGLPFACVESVASRFSIPRQEIAGMLDLPARTFARRKRERRLSANESDRLLRLARIAILAEEVLGSRDKASAWLHERNRALGDEPPLRLLDTDFGARQVEDVLLRVSHGVYS